MTCLLRALHGHARPASVTILYPSLQCMPPGMEMLEMKKTRENKNRCSNRSLTAVECQVSVLPGTLAVRMHAIPCSHRVHFKHPTERRRTVNKASRSEQVATDKYILRSTQSINTQHTVHHQRPLRHSKPHADTFELLRHSV